MRGVEAMRLEVERAGDVYRIRVKESRLTYPMLASFFTEVRGIVEGGARNVVLDLATVAYIDSAAIGCVMDIGRRLEDRGGALKLSGLQRRVATMLSMTGVHRSLAA
jgi:anti-anti-sigma factor